MAPFYWETKSAKDNAWRPLLSPSAALVNIDAVAVDAFPIALFAAGHTHMRQLLEHRRSDGTSTPQHQQPKQSGPSPRANDPQAGQPPYARPGQAPRQPYTRYRRSSASQFHASPASSHASPSSTSQHRPGIPSLLSNVRTQNAFFSTLGITAIALQISYRFLGFDYRQYYPRWASAQERARDPLVVSNFLMDSVGSFGGLTLALVICRDLDERRYRVKGRSTTADAFKAYLWDGGRVLWRKPMVAVGAAIVGYPVMDMVHRILWDIEVRLDESKMGALPERSSTNVGTRWDEIRQSSRHGSERGNDQD